MRMRSVEAFVPNMLRSEAVSPAAPVGQAPVPQHIGPHWIHGLARAFLGGSFALVLACTPAEAARQRPRADAQEQTAFSTLFAPSEKPKRIASRRVGKRAKVAAYAPYAPPYASIVYDVNSGKVLEATNADAPRHPASITKVMTLYVLFEQLESGKMKLTTQLPVSREASMQPPSKLGLKAGESISVEDAIRALVTKSANDVAVVVAEAIGGDEERFAKMMTQKARAIGMRNSQFHNASGLPNPDQITTARDLVTLGRVIQDRFPKYYTYFSTRNFAFSGTSYRNHNRLLSQVEGVDGIKTGYTRASGFNLLTSAKTEGRHLITVVLGGASARSRDAKVASLIENHLPRAFAGRRLTGKTIDVANADPEDSKAAPAAPALAAARINPPPATVPVPEKRVAAKPAPSASEPEEDTGLNRARPFALMATGQGNAVQSASSPLAFNAPRANAAPPMRWINGPAPAAEKAETRLANNANRANERPVPPAAVKYTNAIRPEGVVVEDDQPMPTLEGTKLDARLPSMSARAQIAATTPPPAVGSGLASAPQSPVPGKTPQAENKATPADIKTAQAEIKTPQAGGGASFTLASTGPMPAPSTGESSRSADSSRTVDASITQSAKADAAKASAPLAAPAPSHAAAAPAKASARSGWVIQLAAADSDAKARSILANAKAKADSVLADAEPFTEMVSKGNMTFYRARFGGFDEDDAQSACKSLKRAGFACIAQRV